jgi:hypothetical protein
LHVDGAKLDGNAASGLLNRAAGVLWWRARVFGSGEIFIEFWLRTTGRNHHKRTEATIKMKFHASANLIFNPNQSRDMINIVCRPSEGIHELLILCVMHPSIPIGGSLVTSWLLFFGAV